MQGMHAGGAGALDIAQAVVDEHRRFGFHAIARVEQLEDLAVGLQQALITRYHDTIETVEEIETLARLAELVLVPVGDGKDRDVVALEGFEDIDAPMDRAGNRLMPVRVEGADHRMQFRRVLLDEKLDGVGEAPAPVLLDIPGGRADIGEKPLHIFLAPFEKAAIEVARVPGDEHIADVKDDSGRANSHLFPLSNGLRLPRRLKRKGVPHRSKLSLIPFIR